MQTNFTRASNHHVDGLLARAVIANIRSADAERIETGVLQARGILSRTNTAEQRVQAEQLLSEAHVAKELMRLLTVPESANGSRWKN